MPTFLEDLAGIRELQWEDNAPLPRRGLLSFAGAVTVVDNPAAGSTDVTFVAPVTPGTTGTFNVSGSHAYFAPADPELRLCSLARLATTAPTTLHAMDVEGRALMVLVNVGSDTLTLAHESASATTVEGRFLCPANTSRVLAPGEMVTVIRDDVSARWRVAQ